MSMSTQRDLAREYLEHMEETERLRSQIEEKYLKGLDHLLAHTGTNPIMRALSGLRNWWLMFIYIGMSDPPNEDMVTLGNIKVQMIEWDMAAHVASAEVYHDKTLERRRKVFVAGTRGLRGLIKRGENDGD